MTYVEMIYKLIKEEHEGLDAIYEDSILELVGKFGLYILKKHNLIEACGVVHGRQLYALCDYK